MTAVPAWFYADDRACKGQGSVMFAPGSRGDGTAKARAICSGCPYIEQCRNHAHVNAEPYGVWGGEGPRARFADIRGNRTPTPQRRRVAICGTTGGWRKHYDDGTPPCDACKDAANAYKRELRARTTGRVA